MKSKNDIRDQLNRIEQKLNKIIRFFNININQGPRRSNQEIERMAEEAAEKIMRRYKQKKLSNRPQ